MEIKIMQPKGGFACTEHDKERWKLFEEIEKF